eukprot:Blabericola_migrator_1__3596@NODE_2071_length_3325_cov_82_640577_g621_i1_p1_GENE_NODE_2071_length_3325_cov_82_640577_g621_i1NODE_2071_length_3325_cov_82_640577_g621_i1_p1_ORF_typecomplete_len840_score186_44_NODE_2071_length_3325_cov_82_640577_g621_i1842603
MESPSVLDEDDEAGFLIQDFTTVSPFERLVRTIEKHIRAWNILQPSDCNTKILVPIPEAYKFNVVFKFDDLGHDDLYFRLSATKLKQRKISKFYGKASKYQRWFGLRCFNALEVMSDPYSAVAAARMDTANSLLNAMLAAMQSFNCLSIPVFVCKDGGVRDEHIGFQFQSRSPLRGIDYHSACVRSGNHLLQRLYDLIESPEVINLASTRRLSRTALKEPHLAALFLYFVSHLRLHLDHNPRAAMRWVHIVDDWPMTGELLSSAPTGTAGIQWKWSGAHTMPIRSLHIFVTWSFDFWDVDDPDFQFVPIRDCGVTTQVCQPVITLRPLQGYDESRPLFVSVLNTLLVVLAASSPLSLIVIPPGQTTVSTWTSVVGGCRSPKVLTSKSMSSGDALLMSFIASIKDATPEAIQKKWVSLVQNMRHLCELTYSPCWQHPLVLNTDVYCPFSAFSFGRALDLVLSIMRRKYLQLHWFSLATNQSATNLEDEDYLNFFLTPYPASSEYSLVLSENWNLLTHDSGDMEGLLTDTAALRTLFKKYYLASSVFVILQTRRGVDPDRTRFTQLWSDRVCPDRFDDFAFHRLSHEGLDKVDQHTAAQNIWDHVLKETDQPIHDWELHLFSDLVFETECALNVVEHVTFEELIKACLESSIHIFVKSLAEISIHTRGSPSIVVQAFRSKAKGAAKLLSWDNSKPPVSEVTKAVDTVFKKQSIDTSLEETLCSLDQIIDALHMAEVNCMMALSLLSKLPSISPSLVREILQSSESEEVTAEKQSDYQAAIGIIEADARSLTLASVRGHATAVSYPMPFLKEFLLENEDANLYASWLDDEFRVAWKIQKRLS